MNSNQARSELDAAISRLDTQCDIMSIRLDKSGGISKGSVRVVTEAANKAVVAYYQLVNAEKHEREAETRRVAVEACQRRSGAGWSINSLPLTETLAERDRLTE